MITLGHFKPEPGARPPGGSRRARGGLLLPPILLLIALMLAAMAYVVYVLWPRWPGAPVALDAPEIPITIAGVAFNVPPAAIRMPVQRRPGAHERIDLAFMWPSLKPADTAKPPAPQASPAGTLLTLDRIFMTIAGAGDAMEPGERVRTIYPRYAAAEPVSGPTGLAVLAVREGTPYQGEDLIYDATTPEAPGWLHAWGGRRPALSLRTACRGRGRRRGALPARLARRLAVGGRQYRSADQRPAAGRPARPDPQPLSGRAGLSPDRWRGSPSGNCRSARCPHHRQRGRRRTPRR